MNAALSPMFSHRQRMPLEEELFQTSALSAK